MTSGQSDRGLSTGVCCNKCMARRFYSYMEIIYAYTFISSNDALRHENLPHRRYVTSEEAAAHWKDSRT